jgi:acetyl-CoA synthetase
VVDWISSIQRRELQSTRSPRGLSTARAALSVTWLLARAPDGVRADEVAHALGKSV